MTPTKQLFRQRKSLNYESIPNQKYIQTTIVGRVVSVNSSTKRVSIFCDAIVGTMSNLRYPNGMTPVVGNICIATSPTPNQKNSFYAIAFYS